MPSSRVTRRLAKERRKPRTQRRREAPIECTDVRIEEGVEKIPVPIMRPMLGLGCLVLVWNIDIRGWVTRIRMQG